MCGRYVATSPPDEVANWFGAEAPEVALAPNHNVAPTTDVLAVVEGGPGTRSEGHRLVEAFRWGLVPRWAKDIKIGNRMVNARSEGLATKNAFRSAFAKRRCIVPADAFYEWMKHPSDPKTKQPYLIRHIDGSPLAFAGLWERWRDPEVEDAPVLHTCTVITTEPNAMMARLHDRMPVILPPERWDEWLDPALTDTDHLEGFLVPAADGLLEAHAVDRAVGNVRNRGPELIDPVTPEDEAFPATVT